ncbi:hypothetical protein SDC9_61382 [bioreactor metagenome]|uniref:Uncharacterized protein n=1 Tax=bioreactor metagenome TaxID=1076179 RepID=A0A644XGI1_9ZZZZ
MSRSRAVSSSNGTSVRTPNSATTWGITLKPIICQEATAPSSIDFVVSGTRVASSTERTTPVPVQEGQAPPELNASASAPGGVTVAPQVGQVIGVSAATSSVGAIRCPLGHRWAASRENISRSTLSSSVEVPKVERTPGTPGRWRSASAAGTCCTESTAARGACAIRRRV